MLSIQNFTEAFLREKGKFSSSVTGTLYLTSPHVSLLCQQTVWSVSISVRLKARLLTFNSSRSQSRTLNRVWITESGQEMHIVLLTRLHNSLTITGMTYISYVIWVIVLSAVVNIEVLLFAERELSKHKTNWLQHWTAGPRADNMQSCW